MHCSNACSANSLECQSIVCRGYSINNAMSASLAGLFVPWVLLIQPSLAASAVTPAGLSTSVSQNVHEVISSMTPSTMSPSTITQAPFLPHDLRRRQSTAVFTESTEVRGNISTVTDGDSVCGFVTNDIRKFVQQTSTHRALMRQTGQYTVVTHSSAIP